MGKTFEDFYPLKATVDCVVFGIEATELRVLLIERNLPPFRNTWALPGGFVREGESLEETARRELEEEAGLRKVFLEQLYTFGAPKRDPRGRVITVAYYALVKLSEHPAIASTDAKRAEWFSIHKVPTLAFDHKEIIEVALERLRGKLVYQPIGFELLPKKFTLSELQLLYETVLEQQLDKRNFRKKILSMGLLEALEEKQVGVRHRAAQLFRFDQKRYRELLRQGFNFEIPVRK